MPLEEVFEAETDGQAIRLTFGSSPGPFVVFGSTDGEPSGRAAFERASLVLSGFRELVVTRPEQAIRLRPVPDDDGSITIAKLPCDPALCIVPPDDVVVGQAAFPRGDCNNGLDDDLDGTTDLEDGGCGGNLLGTEDDDD